MDLPIGSDDFNTGKDYDVTRVSITVTRSLYNKLNELRGGLTWEAFMGQCAFAIEAFLNQAQPAPARPEQPPKQPVEDVSERHNYDAACPVCTHPQVLRIEERIFEGATKRSIGRDTGLSVEDISRHMLEHLF